MDTIKSIHKGIKEHPHPILFILMFLPLVIGSRLDGDTWWILNTGRYIMENGIPTIEPFTIHEGLTFYAQQWLSCVLYNGVYSLLGNVGVCFLVFAIGIALTFMIYKLCMTVSEGNVGISCITTFIMNAFLNFSFMVARPQVFTFLIIVCELYFLEKYARTQNWKYLIPIPIFSVLEINLHASMWLMIFVFMAPYFVNSFSIKTSRFNQDGYKKLPLFLTAAIAGIAGLINPYGIKMITYLFRSYGNTTINNTVTEMFPPSWATDAGKISLIFMATVIIGICLHRVNKLPTRYVCFLLGTSVLALSSMKGIAYFVIGATFITAYRFKDKEITFDIIKLPKQYSKTLICLCLPMILALPIYTDITSDSVPNTDVYGAIQYITENYDSEKAVVYTGYNDGGCAEFYGLKVYMDARAEVFLKSNNDVEDIYYEYTGLLEEYHGIQDFIDKYQFTHIITYPGERLYYHLNIKDADTGYDCEYEDEHRQVWVKIVKT